MPKDIEHFRKNREFLICVDSDGCAMDTMDVKHRRCFGPCMIEEWGLQEHAEVLLSRWNEINLYTMTRGINRFRGLAIALSEVAESILPIDGVEELVAWSENSSELSNAALRRATEGKPESSCLAKALSWSIRVNEAISKLPPEDIRPFPLAREALELAHGVADVAIVSSANPDAVLEEWERHRLLPHTDVVMAQNAGTKAACIARLLSLGYSPDRVIMCGDAPGDLAAAEKNGVYFYPILVRSEEESWREFMNEALGRLTDGTYGGDYQRDKKDSFLSNLRG